MLAEYRRRVGAASFDLCFRWVARVALAHGAPWHSATVSAHRHCAELVWSIAPRRFAARTVWTRATLLVLWRLWESTAPHHPKLTTAISRTYECCGQSDAHLELPAAVVRCARPTRTYEELLRCWLAACKTLASKQPSVPTHVRPRKEISTRYTKYRSMRIDTCLM